VRVCVSGCMYVRGRASVRDACWDNYQKYTENNDTSRWSRTSRDYC